jgi:acyl carrier protein phosphodiesterase
MNYLAHAYLSFNHTPILLGNMSSDFIKGKSKFSYPKEMQQGIALHRLIDDFTDSHPSTLAAKKYFKEAVGTYSGAFVDVSYDHFLALDQNEFQDEAALQQFALHTYNELQHNISLLPQQLQTMLPYMQQQNWLYNYRTFWGMERSFEGVTRRAVYLEDASPAFHAFNKNYEAIKACYQLFFPDVKKFAFQQLKLLQDS